ncbi:hypothetical protein [Streptomyces sp. G-5]|uniref:hypothetical protein n=1 Tax=Streptomyces sp. G-5 TaxID=2977231 RepID=UPI0021CE5866|nr:hypothetical protein [Streptomyces sp. G-5]MCU4745604.1 hypothetical protein [Streptomyces sp. G-5]
MDSAPDTSAVPTSGEQLWVTVTLDLPVEQVRDWDRIDIGGRTEKVESVTALHNGRRLHFLRGGRLTLSTGRVLRVVRTVRRGEPIPDSIPAPPETSTSEGHRP